MTRTSLSALMAAGLLAGGLATTSASAADLGGNCCADLEERVAELEATTARKGNRKVSLTVSGWVAQQVMYWDDGEESNVYVTDVGSVSIGTHVKFAGEAVITPGWSAGFVINVEFINVDSLLVSQGTDEGILGGGNAQAIVANHTNSPVAVESAYWFIKSEQLGRLSVGQQSSAADNQAILVDGSGSLVQANFVLYDVNAFFLRRDDGHLSNIVYGFLASCAPLGFGGGGVAGDCDGYPSNLVRYDTPTFAGFSASASWGEDDAWAVSARYAGEWNSVKVAAAIAYNENTDENGPGGLDRDDGFDAAALQIGAYVQHVPTGLFVYGAYAEEYHDVLTDIDAGGGVNFQEKPEGDMWYIKAGIRQKWTPLGHTVLYGEYGEDDDKMDFPLFAAGVERSELKRYGLGVVQEIDAAAMSIWLAWRHYEGSAFCNTEPEGNQTCEEGDGLNLEEGNNNFEDFDLVKAGALISF